jgi:hypothetical protein
MQKNQVLDAKTPLENNMKFEPAILKADVKGLIHSMTLRCPHPSNNQVADAKMPPETANGLISPF